MTPRRQQMLAALQLSGQGERPQQASVREVRLRSQGYGTSPDVIAAPELQASCLPRNNVDHLAPASMRRCSSGLRFFSQHVLQRDWPTLALMRAHPAHRLPAVRSVQEVRGLLKAATPLHKQVSFTTVSRLGLRLHEALSLQGAAIDGHRLQVQVHRGKGANDRSVPLPEDTLALLRLSWRTPRHTTWLFPATGREQQQRATATEPRSRKRVPGAFRTATRRAGSTKTGVAMHPLRHAYAPPLLEAGVNRRLIPRDLGHPRRDTTRVSLPLPHKGHEDASTRSNALMQGLAS